MADLVLAHRDVPDSTGLSTISLWPVDGQNVKASTEEEAQN